MPSAPGPVRAAPTPAAGEHPPAPATPDTGRRTGRTVAAAAAAVAVVLVLFAVPFVANSYWLFLVNLTLVYAVAALGFDILLGWSGQIGLAHAALFGLGAYGSAIALEHGVPMVISLLGVGLLAAVVAVLIGFPAMRLRGYFLSIATLAFGLVIVQLLTSWGSLTGGGGGLAVPIWQLTGITATASTYFLTLLVAVLAYLVAWRALHGRFGRTLRGVRATELAMGSLGVSTLRYKLTAFAVSGFLGAVAGGLYAQLQTFIFPGMFNLDLLVLMLVMVLVGGAGTLFGSVVGATFAVFVVELLQDLGDYQRLAYGVALMLAIGFLPGGIVSLGGRLRARVGWRRGVRPDAAGAVEGGTDRAAS